MESKIRMKNTKYLIPLLVLYVCVMFSAVVHAQVCELDPKFIQDTWSVGDTYYTDRDYTITDMDEFGYMPCFYYLIKTPNDERNNTQSSGYMRFTMPFTGYVNIAFDSRLTSLPAWASEYKIRNRATFPTSLGSQPYMQIYDSKILYYGDCVDLGGNKATGASAGTASNYVVFLESEYCDYVPPENPTCELEPKFGLDTVNNGLEYYTDSAYTITDAGPFAGMVMIKTPNTDRNSTLSSGYLTERFVEGISTYYYVAYDKRATTPPNWLTSTFTKIPCAKIHTSLSTQGWFDVYKRFVNNGECVELGGNKGPGFSGGTVSNYIVLKSTTSIGWQCDVTPPPPVGCDLDPKFVLWIANDGVSCYTDRTYTITDAGPFAGMLMIKTPNNDRNSNMSSDYLTWEVAGNGYLYVAYDKSATTPPNWLTSTFTKIPCAKIHTSLSSQGWLDVYKREVSAGECVSLGANKAPGFSGGTVSNYIVLFSLDNIPDQCDTTPPPPPPSACALDPKFVHGNLTNGAKYYTDRTYTIVGAGPFAGMQMVKTPNNERNSAMPSDYLKYDVTENGYLYVAYDRRATTPPNWLTSTFTQIPCAKIRTSLSSQGWLEVYKRAVSYGECVSLGGNKGPGFSGGIVSNYIVLTSVNNVGDQCDVIPPKPGPCALDYSKFIQTSSWTLGHTYYTDRAYTITGVQDPSDLQHLCTIIKTPNDDRNNTQLSGYMQFEMPIDAVIYIAFDSRLTSLPTWASGYNKWYGHTITTSLYSQPYMQLYYKNYTPGDCVSLGGNKASGASAGTASNYVVFIEATYCDTCSLDAKFEMSHIPHPFWGTTYYTDRDYTITWDVISEAFSHMIKTPNADRLTYYEGPYMTFEAPDHVRSVWIAFDSRHTQLPNWTSEYTKWERSIIETSLATQPYLQLYYKLVEPGQCIELGGNKAPGAGTYLPVSNYIVFLSDWDLT